MCNLVQYEGCFFPLHFQQHLIGVQKLKGSLTKMRRGCQRRSAISGLDDRLRSAEMEKTHLALGQSCSVGKHSKKWAAVPHNQVFVKRPLRAVKEGILIRYDGSRIDCEETRLAKETFSVRCRCSIFAGTSRSSRRELLSVRPLRIPVRAHACFKMFPLNLKWKEITVSLTHSFKARGWYSKTVRMFTQLWFRVN